MGQLFALAALVLFSCNVLLVKVAAPRLAQQVGFLVGLLGNVVFGTLLFAVSRLFASQPLSPDWHAIGLFVVAGVFASYLGRRWFFRSVETIGPSRASALQITNPAFAAVLGFLFLHERLRLGDLAAMAAVLGGLLLTSRVREQEAPQVAPVEAAVLVGNAVGAVPPAGRSAPRDGMMSRLRQPTVALPRREIGLALFSALAYAIGNVIRSDAVHRWSEPILGGLLGASAGTAVYLVVHTSPRELWRGVRVADRTGVALWVLSGVVTVTAQVCVIAATLHIQVAIAIVISSALPVIVVPASLLLFGNKERISAHTVLGIALILAGVAALLLR